VTARAHWHWQAPSVTRSSVTRSSGPSLPLAVTVGRPRLPVPDFKLPKSGTVTGGGVHSGLPGLPRYIGGSESATLRPQRGPEATRERTSPFPCALPGRLHRAARYLPKTLASESTAPRQLEARTPSSNWQATALLPPPLLPLQDFSHVTARGRFVMRPIPSRLPNGRMSKPARIAELQGPAAYIIIAIREL
jgi:hypothetical protein